jgi:predicted aspartyl protease
VRFPYRRYRARSSTVFHQGIVTRPELLVDVVGPAGTVSVLALVDTGSDVTLLPRSVAGRIGAVIDDNVRWPVGGFGGRVIEASPGQVELEILGDTSSIRWKATIAFVYYPAGAEESSLLGHAGFFDFFRVTFDGPARELEIQLTPVFGGTSG